MHGVKRVHGVGQLITVPQNSTRVAYQVMSQHAIDCSRGRRITTRRLRSASGIRPAQTEIIHVLVDLRESMQTTGRGWIGAGGYKGGSRGAVLVHCTCGCDILAGIVVRRHPEVICIHPSLLASVGLWAHRSEQCGYQRGGSAYRAVGNRAWAPPPTAQVNPGAPTTLRRCPGHCFSCR